MKTQKTFSSIKIERMTAGELKNGGAGLVIHYGYAKSPFGETIAASTAKGLCYMAFVMKNEADSLKEFKRRFPKANFFQKQDKAQKNALQAFLKGKKDPEITLHVKGTDFQLKVWQALLKIPMGGLTTYGEIASSIKKPKAFRAVGTAVGKNPVSFLIPCHRVVPSSGALGNYHWGPGRKRAMIDWEAVKRADRAANKAGDQKTPPAHAAHLPKGRANRPLL